MGLRFCEAFEKARFDGARIRRTSWGGTEAWIRVVGGTTAERQYMLIESIGEYDDYIKRNIYTPCNEDIFANDWEIIR